MQDFPATLGQAKTTEGSRCVALGRPVTWRASGRGEQGTVLLAVIVVSLILGLWLAVLAVRVREAAWTAAGLGARLQAQNAAANCVAHARAILAEVEPNELLRGPNGVFDCTEGPDLRNPVSLGVLFGEAEPPEAPCDDGFPGGLVQSLRGPAVAFEDGSIFFLRFSNNPEEGDWEDHDGVVLARCFGGAGRPGSAAGSETARAVAMIEVRLRKASPSPESGASGVRLEYWRPLFPEMQRVF
ncbi:MAG: hypothetical protein Kow00109_19660 [Acidobacteriota bacterium]